MQKRARMIIINIIIIIILFSSTFYPQDGKYLRGDIWQRFDIENSNADFYVSPAGNDNWSGTLESPNPDNSDGPFKTIERAQKAVRELKNKVYKPKGVPIDHRFVGSPHPFGSGKDIVVLIREGYYELKNPLNFSFEDGGERVETFAFVDVDAKG